jgi:hypothetical protein
MRIGRLIAALVAGTLLVIGLGLPRGQDQDLRDAPNDQLDSNGVLGQARKKASDMKGPSAAAVKTALPDAKTYVFDKALVQGDNGGKTRQAEAYLYEDAQTALLFIAAQHRNDRTIGLTKAAFAGRPPWNVVIIERESYRLHPCGQEEKVSLGLPIPESCLAMDLVEKANAGRKEGDKIQWEDGEYDPPDLLDAIIARGKFDLGQYETFWLLRTMTGNENRAKRDFCDKNIPFDDAAGTAGMFSSLSKEFMQEFGASKAVGNDESRLLTSEKFLQGYADGNKHELATVKASKDTYFCGPDLVKEAWSDGELRTQKVLSESTQTKDVHVGEKIAADLNQGRRVLVIYGAAHYADLAAGLQAMIGPGKLMDGR